jgi:hypothetical protein
VEISNSPKSTLKWAFKNNQGNIIFHKKGRTKQIVTNSLRASQKTLKTKPITKLQTQAIKITLPTTHLILILKIKLQKTITKLEIKTNLVVKTINKGKKKDLRTKLKYPSAKANYSCYKIRQQII